jgi:periplasmic divalent cation tolerance protein
VNEVCEVIITAPDPDWLTEFSRRLIADRLCSSGHNITEVRSLYRWRGEIHDRPEARVTLRTRRSLVKRIVERARDEHPYEVPSVVAVPIIDGNPDYIRWIHEETQQS